MTTFALIYGSGDGGGRGTSCSAACASGGHEAVAPDLPTARDDVTWGGCTHRTGTLADADHHPEALCGRRARLAA